MMISSAGNTNECPRKRVIPLLRKVVSVAVHVLLVFRRGARDLCVPPPGNVPGLDVLRSLAIILVISAHYSGEFSTARHQTLSIGRFPLFYFGWTGVDLFFVLSGYLIGRQLWRELARRNTINVPVFLLRRGLRIWPFYFTFLAWTFLTSHQPRSDFIPDLFFVSNYMPDAISGSWSLSTEEQFYVFVPLLLIAVSALVRTRHQFIVIAALMLVLPLIRFITLSAHPAGITPDQFQRLIQLPFHTHADGLVVGLLISWLSILRPQFLEPLPVRRNVILPATLSVAGVVLRDASPHLFGFSGLALIFGSMALFVLRDRSLLSRLASGRIFYVTSRLSYGMYLNHFPILAVGVPLFVAGTTSFRPYSSFFVGYPLAVVASMIVAAFTFVVIESPFLQLRDRWLARGKGQRTLDQSAPPVTG
jgi:peptidoglycan/LPS O-acetylase OafA/YrhL